MRFFNRIFDSDHENNAPAHEVDINSKTATSILSEIDIDAAIVYHEKWRKHLLEYAMGKSTEELDPKIVCTDDHCELGIWLRGIGKERLGKYPAFSILVTRHKYFHAQASNVVEMAQSGKNEEAVKLITGPHAYASNQIMLLLKELQQDLTNHSQ